MRRLFVVISLISLVACANWAQRLPDKTAPKRELRSAWVATVWGIDWPRQGASAESQKAALCRMLDSLKNNNFNAINFQIRSMSDAMYKSSYEPWSSYLTGKRGTNPGYDPLAFAISECHKRGMELHAWINPYRFSAGALWNTERDQEARKHLLRAGKITVLNPSHQWTIDRIVNVCREVVTKYDVDGILYDDYFYPDGISSTALAGDYKEWQESGTELNIGDWRRANVAKMIKAVYEMIQKTKPWVRYGISPAGIACTQQWLADKHGVTPCPSGNDWQYAQIFSDPVHWLKAHIVDYVAPQVYWKRGNKRADYSLLAPWWCKTATQLGRQAFVSAGIDKLTFSYEMSEYEAQVLINRSSCESGQAGIVFWSVKNLYNKSGFSEQLCHYLKRTVFQTPALVPVNKWRNRVVNAGTKINLLKVNGNHLTWQLIPRLRYTVYAIPDNIEESQFKKEAKYLLGMVYNPQRESESVSFAIPSDKRSGHYFAVCALDRFGNEYEPSFAE